MTRPGVIERILIALAARIHYFGVQTGKYDYYCIVKWEKTHSKRKKETIDLSEDKQQTI